MAIKPSFSLLSYDAETRSDGDKEISVNKRNVKNGTCKEIYCKESKKKNNSDTTTFSSRKSTSNSLHVGSDEHKETNKRYKKRYRRYTDASTYQYNSCSESKKEMNVPETVNVLKERWLSTSSAKRSDCKPETTRRATISCGNSGRLRQRPKKKGNEKVGNTEKNNQLQKQSLKKAYSEQETRPKQSNNIDSTIVDLNGLIEIKAERKSKKGLHAVDNLNFSKDWAYDMSSFLRVIRLHKYEKALQKQNVCFEDLLKMSDEDLDRAGITAKGARNRMSKAIEKYVDYMELDFKYDDIIKSRAILEQKLRGDYLENSGAVSLFDENEDMAPPTLNNNNDFDTCETKDAIQNAATRTIMEDTFNNKEYGSYLVKQQLAAESIFEISPRLNSPPLSRRRNSLGTWVDLEKAKHLNVIKSITEQEYTVSSESGNEKNDIDKKMNMLLLTPVDSIHQVEEEAQTKQLDASMTKNFLSREEELSQFHLKGMFENDAEQLLDDLDNINDNTNFNTARTNSISNDNGHDKKGINIADLSSLGFNLLPTSPKSNNNNKSRTRSISIGTANSRKTYNTNEIIKKRFPKHSQRIPSPIEPIFEREESAALMNDEQTQSFDCGSKILVDVMSSPKKNLCVGRKRSLTFDSLSWGSISMQKNTLNGACN